MDIVKPRQQQIWRWPAVLNFTLGSMGAGYFVWTWLDVLLAVNADGSAGAGHAGVVAAGSILGGFFALLFEAGNPLKSYLTFLNVRHSWMSRELWLALIFAGFVGFGLVYPGWLPLWIPAVTAFLFIMSQAFIIYRSRAIRAWNVWPVVPLFILTGLSSGFGLFLILEWEVDMGSTMLLLGGATWMMCLGALLYYLFGFAFQDSDFRAATGPLRTPGALVVGTGVGLVLPFALLAMVTGGVMGSYAGVATTLAGAGAILGAGLRNHSIVMKAGYFRRIGIEL